MSFDNISLKPIIPFSKFLDLATETHIVAVISNFKSSIWFNRSRLLTDMVRDETNNCTIDTLILMKDMSSENEYDIYDVYSSSFDRSLSWVNDRIKEYTLRGLDTYCNNLSVHDSDSWYLYDEDDYE